MKIVALTGAGISRESGLKTFRDSNGLWENHEIEDVATFSGFQRNPQLVLDFYNERRRQVCQAEPNDGHRALAALGQNHHLSIITQNIDDLHERAGTQSEVIHIHGNIHQVIPVSGDLPAIRWQGDCNVGDFYPGTEIQLRPDVVWFGEPVRRWANCVELVKTCDVLIISGTSAEVYPAALLINLTNAAEIFVVDPKPPTIDRKATILTESASTGIPKIQELLNARNSQ